MGTTDYGTQTITFRYNQALISSDLGKLLYNITKPGIYDGGNLTINSGNNVNIAPLDLLVETSALQMMHVKTTTNIVFPITESTPYITCQFTWVDSTTNYMDFTAKAVGDLLTSDVVVGMGVYVASTLTSFSYTSKTWGTFDRSGNMRSTNVIAATDVTILGANGLYNSTKALTTYGNTTVAKTANYVMLDNDGYSRIECNTTSNAIAITLPLMANNISRRIEIALVKNDASLDVVTISPHATNAGKLSTDLLASIVLSKVEDFIVIQQSATLDCWEIIDERITCEIAFLTSAGYGSTDTCVLKFAGVLYSIGNFFSHNHGAYGTKGLEVTILKSGHYYADFLGWASGVGQPIDITANATVLNAALAYTSVYSMAHADVNGSSAQISALRYYVAGTIIRFMSFGAHVNTMHKGSISYRG